MAIWTQAQPPFIVDTEAERSTSWPDGSLIHCLDTDKTYILCSGSFHTVSGSTGTGGASAWGDITGTLSAQTDLQTALNAKVYTSALGRVWRSVTMTNIGTAYKDVYSGTAFDEEHLLSIDFTGINSVRMVFLWDYVGSGTQKVRLADKADNTNVLIE